MRAALLIASVALLVGCLAPRAGLQVFPAGVHEANDEVFLILPADLEQIAVAAECQGTPVPLLFEHAHGTKAGAAAGFLYDYRVTPRGMWARVHWTEEGIHATCRGGWRYISPHFTAERDEDGNLHPDKLIEVSLTNVPAFEGMEAVEPPPCPLAMFSNERMAR